MAVVNNNAGNKMDAFFVHDGEASRRRVCCGRAPDQRCPSSCSTTLLRSCQDTSTSELIVVTCSASTAPDGSNRLRLAVYLPKGAYLGSTSPQQLFTGEERGHPVAMFGVELKRGERKTVSVDFTEFGDPTLLNQNPEVLEQPMLNPQQISIQTGPRCA